MCVNACVRACVRASVRACMWDMIAFCKLGISFLSDIVLSFIFVLSNTRHVHISKHSLHTPVRKPVQFPSSSFYLLFVPRVNTNSGTRAFSAAASSLWNMFTISVRSVKHIAQCRRHLKMYLYPLAYPP